MRPIPHNRPTGREETEGDRRRTRREPTELTDDETWIAVQEF